MASMAIRQLLKYADRQFLCAILMSAIEKLNRLQQTRGEAAWLLQIGCGNLLCSPPLLHVLGELVPTVLVVLE
jgi:hypothetical protein